MKVITTLILLVFSYPALSKKIAHIEIQGENLNQIFTACERAEKVHEDRIFEELVNNIQSNRQSALNEEEIEALFQWVQDKVTSNVDNTGMYDNKKRDPNKITKTCEIYSEWDRWNF